MKLPSLFRKEQKEPVSTHKNTTFESGNVKIQSISLGMAFFKVNQRRVGAWFFLTFPYFWGVSVCLASASGAICVHFPLPFPSIESKV
jgi:hypothetical protein